MKRLVIIHLTVVLLLATMVGVGCGNDKEEESPTVEGGLPTLKVGDKWVSRIVSEGIEYTTTVEVTGEDVSNGKDCYICEASIEPAVEGIIDSMTAKLDKATMLPVRTQTSGEYMDMPFVVASSYSYEFPGALPYPREVGKEYEVIGTETTTSTVMGETETETTENTYIYKVEKIEEITVPAGTFRCFKEVKYDETGTTALETSWHSDKTKQYSVKEIDHETGDTTELTSYSL